MKWIQLYLRPKRTPITLELTQQSLNVGGLPFPVTVDNAEYMKAEAMKRLMKELDAGKESGELVDEAEVYRMMGVEP